MKFDDPNHDPSQPLVCKQGPTEQELEVRAEHVRYAIWEACALRFGITDQLKIRREYEAWKEGE